MSETITYVGIDAHKVDLQVAMLAPDATVPVTWTVANEARAVEQLRRKLERTAPGPSACCYEAGPCDYALQRQLDRGRVRCEVIAPALVPRKPGERIKTDRRDARTRNERTRTLASLPLEGLLRETASAPAYQRLAGLPATLRVNRWSDPAIAVKFGVTDKTIAKAVRWFRSRACSKP